MVPTPEHATSNPHSAEGGGQNLSTALDAAPAAVVKPADSSYDGFFSMNDEGDVEFHATADAARAAAQNTIDTALDWNDNAWPEDMQRVCWGQVIERAVEVDREDHEDYGHKASEHDAELHDCPVPKNVDWTCHYRLERVSPAEPDDDGRLEAMPVDAFLADLLATVDATDARKAAIAAMGISVESTSVTMEINTETLRGLVRHEATLRDLVTEAAELARHLLDAGPCPECGQGECEACEGYGCYGGDANQFCMTCQGTGERPHAVDCRLATFQARAQAALGGGK